jgi:hypothetical protein
MVVKMPILFFIRRQETVCHDGPWSTLKIGRRTEGRKQSCSEPRIVHSMSRTRLLASYQCRGSSSFVTCHG